MGIFVGVSLLGTILSFRSKSPIRKLFLPFVALLWISIGLLNNGLQESFAKPSHFKNIYTQGDSLILKTNDVAPTATNRFQKTIGEVKAIIKGKDTIPTTGKLLCYFEDNDQLLQPNQYVLFTPTITEISNRNNPGEFDAVNYWKYQNVGHQSFVPDFLYVRLHKDKKSIFSIFDESRVFLAKIIDSFVSGQEGAVAKGLILGDRSSIEAETTRMFGTTGVMHILAVSGMHVAILVLILNYILQLFPKYISKKNAVLISLIVVWFYSLMTGFSASVARSAWMFTFVAGGVLLNRSHSSVNGLFFSALVILMFSPYALYDIGFQLSYAAMIGIYTFYPFLKKQLYFKNKWVRNIWDGIALSIAAQLITTPFCLYYFHQFPNYFLLTNIALSAYSLVILSLGLALFVFGWWKFLGKTFGFLLYWVMFSMLWIIQFIDALPQAVSEGFVLSGWIVVVLYALIGAFYWTVNKQKYSYLVGVLAGTVLVVSVIVYNRFQNMNTAHFIVFNNNGATLAIKEENSLIVFYDTTNVKAKNLDQLISSYTKIYPSVKQTIVPLPKYKAIELKSSKNTLNIADVKGGYTIQLNDNQYFLATSSHYENPQNKNIILAPTMTDNTAFYQLNKGSFIVDLE